MKTESGNRGKQSNPDSYGTRLFGMIITLIIILYTVSLMVEKLRF